MKRKYFIIISGLFALTILSAVILVNVAENNSIIYEHEKHYREYKERNGEEFGDILTETRDKTVRLTGNGNYDVSYLFENLNPFDSLTIRLDSTVDEGYANLFLDYPFSLYDGEGEILADIYVGPSGSGYYDPFDREWESCVWVSNIDGDSLTLKLLAVEKFFMGYEVFPNVLTESDFSSLKEI